MVSKISMIKGDTTPEVFCAKLMETAKDIEHIACVVCYKEDAGTQVFKTTMRNVDLAWLRWIFDQECRPLMENEDG